MSPRLPVIAGLVTGAIAAAVLLVLLVAFLPDPGTQAPTPPPQLPSASTAATSPGPSAEHPSAPPSAAPSGSASAANFHVGEPAPPLSVPQVGGGTIDLAALRGKPVWVNFMATWCPPCIDELPRMNGFAARYADDGLIVLAVDVREEEGEVAAFAESLEVTFPVGLDTDGAAQAEWGAMALPVHFWIDADGIVREGALGGIGPDVMARGVQAIMPGTEVTP